MSERSFVSILILACPEDQWEPLQEIFTQYGIALRDDYPATFPYDHTDDEVVIGYLANACEVIAALLPEVYFWNEQDAFYEYSGDRCIQIPEFPYAHYETDNSGYVPVTPGTLDSLASTCNSKEELVSKLNEYMGTDVLAVAQEWRDRKRKPQFAIQEQPELT